MAKELERSPALLQTVVDAVADAILVIDRDYRVRWMNAAARELSGQTTTPASAPDVICCHTLTHGIDDPCTGHDHPCPMATVAETKAPVTVLHTHRLADGTTRAVEVRASPLTGTDGEFLGIVEVGRDVTQRLQLENDQKLLETRLIQQQKEESFARLAGGIAHDFTNALTAVLGSAELLQSSLGNRASREVDAIFEAADRMSKLTKQLLAYAKSGSSQPVTMSLNTSVMAALELAHKGEASATELDIDLATDLWPVFADPGQMNQVLVNLMANAFEAMEGASGNLTVRTFNLSRDQSWPCRHHGSHPAGDYVVSTFTDSGPGVPEELRDRMFEPFVGSHAGRGLGLAAALGIVTNHGGCIELATAPDGGTTAQVLLPRAREAEARVAARRPTVDKAPRGHVLVIDDEPPVLWAVQRMLSRHGYDVITACGGSEGLELFEQKQHDLDLVILDIQMPDVNGREVYREIKSRRADAPILISSGYPEETALEGIELDPEDAFLQKPYRVAVLVDKVRQTARKRP